MAEGDTVSGPGWTLEAIATPGHTSNHLCFALPEAQALFTGDHVMGWSTSVVIPPDGHMGAYMASLEKLMPREDVLFFPAHGDPVTKPRQLLRGMLGHRKQREGQILRLLRQGGFSVPDMVAQMYVGLDPRLAKAAGASVLAHLIDLDRRGQVKAEGDVWSLAA
jgi:glyoxylase-like metal-dependent hydrolase (beta-lactamase superfamily II)